MNIKIQCLVLLALFFGHGFGQDSYSSGWKSMLKLWNDCKQSSDGIMMCIKMKSVVFLDLLSRMDKFPLIEGVNVVKINEVPTTLIISENHLERSLPRNLDIKNQILNNMIIERISNFLNTRTLQVSLKLPEITSKDIEMNSIDYYENYQRSFVEEGRKKGGGGGGGKKKMMGMMAGMGMKMAALLPLKMGLVLILILKALIKAKLALLIGIIVLLMKIGSKGGGGGGGGHGGGGGGHGGGGGWQSGGGGGGGGHGGGSGWQSGGGGGGGWQSGGGGGGWDAAGSGGPYKRSFNIAQNLAYNGYIQS